jgi:hypothetical protein
LATWFARNVFIIIGDKELPPALEGRTGALPPALQRYITYGISVKNREKLTKLYITHFRALPVRSGWIDNSIIRYEPVSPSFDLLAPYEFQMDESGFVFRPWTYRVEFETFRAEKFLRPTAQNQ